MSNTRLVSLHLPAELVERIDRLVREVETNGETRCTRASIMRRALQRGVKALERKKQRAPKNT